MEERELTEEQQIILDMFEQSCSYPGGTFYHHCISAYESAQSYLVKHGIISADDCEFETRT